MRTSQPPAVGSYWHPSLYTRQLGLRKVKSPNIAGLADGELGFETQGCSAPKSVSFLLTMMPPVQWDFKWETDFFYFFCPRHRSLLFVLRVERRKQTQCYRKSVPRDECSHAMPALPRDPGISLSYSVVRDIRLFESLFQRMPGNSFILSKILCQGKLYPIALTSRCFFSPSSLCFPEKESWGWPYASTKYVFSCLSTPECLLYSFY